MTTPCPHCLTPFKRCEADVNAKGRDGRDDPMKAPDRRICAVTGIVIERYAARPVKVAMKETT